jgi:hypothetical protein
MNRKREIERFRGAGSEERNTAGGLEPKGRLRTRLSSERRLFLRTAQLGKLNSWAGEEARGW